MAKIGVFDSGLGGLTNLFDLEKRFTNEYVYVADQKNSPYGNKSPSELITLALKIVDFFVAKQCSIVVIACNTMSAVALNTLKVKYPQIQFIGVIDAVCHLINESNFKNILLIATKATIDSQVYVHNVVKTLYPVATVELASAIENGDEKKIVGILNNYLLPYKNQVDAICLGCTHYTLVKEQIQKILNVEILDAVQAFQSLHFPNEKASIEVYTTNNPQLLEKNILKLFQRKLNVKLLEEKNESYYL